MSTMNNVLFYSPKNASFPHDARFMFSSPIQLHHDRVTSTRQHAHVSHFSLSNTHTHLSNDARVPIFPTSCSSLDAFHFYLNLFQYTSPSHTTKHTHTHTHTHTYLSFRLFSTLDSTRCSSSINARDDCHRLSLCCWILNTSSSVAGF